MIVWAVVKTVLTTATPFLGCMVGPFETEDAAKIFAERASLYCLGYEKWVVRELQKPSDL